jgi:hypothetical protein
MIEVLKNLSIEQNSEEKTMKYLAEYSVKHIEVETELNKHISSIVFDYYEKKNQIIKKKQMLLKASGLLEEERENITLNNKLKNDIDKNSKILKVLSI